jgi:hemolysin activation/secretion protein
MNFKIGLIATLVVAVATASRAQPVVPISTSRTKPNGPACRVTAYNIEGNTVLPPESFDFLTNYTGPAVDLARLREGLGGLQLLYRNLGFAAASVTLPQQHLTNGIVRVQVVEGKPPGNGSARSQYLNTASFGRPPPGFQTNVLVSAGQTRTASQPSTNSVKPAEPSFRVTSYDIEGNTVLPKKRFDFLTNYTGPAVTIARLREGLGELQLLYRNLGFATVSVTLPQQRLTNGIVRVDVIEGKLAEISVTGNHHFSSNNVRSALPSLTTNILVNTKWLQREIDRANQNPDRQIYPVVSPDEEPGFTDLALRVKDRLPLHGHIEVNDKSTPGTPLLRIDSALQYNNLWQLNQQIGLQYDFSPQSMKGDDYLPRFYDQPMVASYSAFYRIPFGFGDSLREDYERLPVDFGYNEVTHQFNLPQPSGNPELTMYGSRSSSDTPVRFGPLTSVISSPLVEISSQSAERDLTFTENIGAKYTLPLKEIAGFHPSLTLGFDFKSYRLQGFSTNLSYFTTTLTNNGVASTSNSTIALPSNTHQQVTYMPLSWILSGDRPDKRGTTGFSLEQDAYLSPLDSSRPNFQVAAGSQEAGGDFTEVLASLTREEKLPGGWSMLARAAGQWASEPLISNEEMPLGGTAGVRGYQEGETYGDSGWRTTFDLRAPAMEMGSFPVNGGGRIPGMWRPSLFMDYGEAYLLDRTHPPAVQQWGTGMGFFLTAGEHIDARLSLGWALLRTATATPGSLQAYFAVGFQF